MPRSATGARDLTRRAPRRPASPRVRSASGIRWDRVGRAGLLVVLLVLVYLYISPLRHLLSTYQQAGQQRQAVAALARKHAELKAERASIGTPATIEVEARTLGMVFPGEQGYVVQGLPSN